MGVQNTFFVDPDSFDVVPQPKAKLSGKACSVNDCRTCGLATKCGGPLPPVGRGRLGILVVADAPTAAEESRNAPFSSYGNRLLERVMAEQGINLLEDCRATYVVRCPLQKTSYEKAAACCYGQLDELIRKEKPSLIICTDARVFKWIAQPPFACKTELLRGIPFPVHRYNAWVLCVEPPATLVRTFMLLRGKRKQSCSERDLESFVSGKSNVLADDVTFIGRHLDEGLCRLGTTLPAVLDPSRCTALLNYDEAISAIRALKDANTPFGFDYETTCLSPWQGSGAKSITPWHPKADVLCVTWATSEDHGFFLPIVYGNYWSKSQREQLKAGWGAALSTDAPKWAYNAAFEYHWSREVIGATPRNLRCSMVAQHIVDHRRYSKKLEFNVFRYWGDVYKDEVSITKFADEPLHKALKYATLDSRYLMGLVSRQADFLQGELATAAEFFCSRHESLLEGEHDGILLDVDVLAPIEAEANRQLDQAIHDIMRSAEVQAFEDKYKSTFKPTTHEHVKQLLFEVMELPKPKVFEQGEVVDSETGGNVAINYLRTVLPTDHKAVPLLDALQTHSKLTTKLNFVKGFTANIHDDGLLHPSFLLSRTETYRSSAVDPNFQNPPKRDVLQADFRKAFRPYYGQLIAEVDAQASEVTTLGMLTNDDVLIGQILEGVDPHRFWASRLFGIPEDQVTKRVRFLAKQYFVFPEFYGSYFRSIYDNLIGCRQDGDPVLQLEQVEATEKLFWDTYKAVADWQVRILDTYKRYGYVTMPLGFRRYGPLSKNQIINTPVQGTSFHMLLEAFYRARRRATERGLRSRLVAEVHDSLVGDVFEEETHAFMRLLYEVMTEKQWDWQGRVPRRCDMALGPHWLALSEYTLPS